MARTVIVTGGTGALGRTVVRSFLEAGDRLVVPWVAARERDALQDEARDAVRDDRLVLLEADVAEAAGAAAVSEAAETAEVLVNGVGGFAGGTPVHETPLELWDRMLRINARTAWAMCGAVVPGMLARGGGVILNVAATVAGTRPAGLAAYATSKAAVVVLTETLQKEVAHRGLRINAVAPTTIDTPANRAAMPDADPAAWTPPARIAAVLRWLASEEARAVRGAVVPV